jgi:uridine kinase
MSDAIESISTAILALGKLHPLRVLIDGRSAAGKTTFSEALAGRLAASGRQVVLVHFDDFHPTGYRTGGGSAAYTPESYLEGGFDFGAFHRMVMAPAGPAGSRRLTLSLEDLSQEAVLSHDGIVVADGCFLAKPSLRAQWDFMIWLDVSFETMIRRAAVRDVAWVGDEAKVRHRYETFWRETHDLYERQGPRETADAIIDNEEPNHPRLIRLGNAG